MILLTYLKWLYSSSSATGGSATTSRHLYDGDFIRLRDLTVNYNLPKSLRMQLGLMELMFLSKVLNLLTWTKDKDLPFDPEIRMGGSFRNNTPPLKSISLGANIKF